MTARTATLMAMPALTLLLAASPASAQDVRADVRIRTGPVDGRVVIDTDRRNDRVIVVDRDRRDDDRIIVSRRAPRRVTIVEDFRPGTQRAHARHDDHHVVAYWDARRDEYGFRRWRPGLRAVLLCEHGNRYFVVQRGFIGHSRYDRYDRDDYRDDRRDDARDDDRDRGNRSRPERRN